MNRKDFCISKFREGLTNKEIATLLKCATHEVSQIRVQLGMPHANLCRILIENIDFCDYFKEIYSQDIKVSEMVNIVSKHKLVSRIKFCHRRFSSVRNFLNLDPKMIERSYNNDYDRIRGYIIRNSKYCSKRRDLEFNLEYTDFEIPTHCPILNIKLKYLHEDPTGNAIDHATLDRIDNSKGYIKGNVIIISRLANAMKNEASFEQLKIFTKNVTKLIDHYENLGALGSITDIFGPFEPKVSLDS